jgi:hypothetical protein
VKTPEWIAGHYIGALGMLPGSGPVKKIKKLVIGKLHSPPYIACILQPVSEIFTNLRGAKTPESIAGNYIGALGLLPGSGTVKEIKKSVIGKLHSPLYIACILQPVSEIVADLRGTKTPELSAVHYISVLASLPCSGPGKKFKKTGDWQAT